MGIDKDKHAFVAHGLRPLNLKDTLQREAVLATFNWVPWASDAGSGVVVLKTLTLLLEDVPQFIITIVFLSQTGSAFNVLSPPLDLTRQLAVLTCVCGAVHRVQRLMRFRLPPLWARSRRRFCS